MKIRTLFSALILCFCTSVQASPQIYIFISSSMREANLIELAKEAKLQNAQLVLRGLINNSFEHTVKFLANMIQVSGHGVLVDPTLFQTYSVTVIPTFVVTEDTTYDKLTGNIGLMAALQKMGRL